MRSIEELTVSVDSRDRDVLLDCLKVVRSFDPAAQIIFFGSRARRDARPDSDMDILVILDQTPDYTLTRAIRDKIYDICLSKDIVISVLVRSKSQWNAPISQVTPFYRTLQQEGILVS
jgi:predicted nucleotidyltransferase